jgi:hypothetical protein
MMEVAGVVMVVWAVLMSLVGSRRDKLRRLAKRARYNLLVRLWIEIYLVTTFAGLLQFCEINTSTNIWAANTVIGCTLL